MAQNTLLHAGINFSILPDPPAHDRPSPIAIFAPSCGAYLCSGDCVEISGPPASFIGRIIRPSYHTSLLEFDASVHPRYVSSANTSDMGSALINLYLDPEGANHLIPPDEWPTVSMKHHRCCIGLKQATITNLVVWVHAEQILRVVFCPHLMDCVMQTFGPMGGRYHTFYVQSKVILDNSSNYSFHSLESNEYSIFTGTSPIPRNGQPTISSFTHRIIQSLYAISRENSNLLTKSGRLASIVHSKFFLPFESFRYLYEHLRESFPEITTSNIMASSKHAVLHGNLSLETTKLPTYKVTILAKCQRAIIAVRGALSNQMGVGVRKRAPPLSAMNIPSRNPATLQSTDTINIIDDIFEGTEIDGSWIDEDAGGSEDYQSTGRNLIRWVYDTRLNTCRMSMVCFAIKIGSCVTPGLTAYLHANEIAWSETKIREGTNLTYEDDMWVVRSVSVNNDTVVIFNQFTHEEKIISIELAENSLM